MKEIEILKTDITKLIADVIVNAANNALCGGGGVDGAIHRAAGEGLLAECMQLGRCETGSAKITGAYNLPAKYVVHAVGPVWYGGDRDESKLLKDCYKEAFRLADEKDAESIAFPAISCGAYRFPIPKACSIALSVSKECLDLSKSLKKVYFVCFDPKVEKEYRKLLANN